TRSGKVMR
nr:Chain G, AceCS2-KLeu [Homo sapiens]5YTK_J Chain J, AceCS2-KLeu [Homo sapiens]5YTK_K Chain K, AceCS2-KLeu [Homo sapiens]5YTK_L Chain L, AceCS2-KLeu [Homo sapiens]